MTTANKQRTFPRGGVHPPGTKSRTRDLPLSRSTPPDELAVLLSQHIGAPAQPAVDKRDEVLMGQIIGRAGGYVSANIHAPVSGKVKKVENRPHPPTGKPVPAIIIQNDGEDTWAEGCNEEQNPENLSPEEMVDLVQNAGIVGMGGATFPAHVKLSPPPEKPVSDVILNGAECEPLLTCDHRVMVEQTDNLLDAMRLIMRMVDADSGHIGIEVNKPEAIEAFEQATRGESDMEVHPLKVQYPQGAEQQLITAITGREVPSGGGLPADVGCVVHNVATAIAIRDAIRFRRPLIERPLTVTGESVREAGNFIERIGTSARHILERQGIGESANQLIMGGPMMGVAQAELDVPITRGTSGLILRRAQPPGPQRACIRCGRCVEHCPLGLIPSELSIYAEKQEWDLAKQANIMECKECGCCAYVCPANRRIVHLVQFGKAELAKQRQKTSDE
ncbi:MAG: electron transport complex subunit RsxC [Candidatus Brocadiia bacterium]